jgi:hypothetical protein
MLRGDVDCHVINRLTAGTLLGETLDYCGIAYLYGLRYHSHVHNIRDNLLCSS